MTRSSIKYFLKNSTEDKKIKLVSPVFEELYSQKNLISVEKVSLYGEMVVVSFKEYINNKLENKEFYFGIDYLIKI